jgi:hypothetical protein
MFGFNQGLKPFLIKLVIGFDRSQNFFKTGNQVSFNFGIMVTGNRFFKDISKTIITVKPGSHYTVVTCILPDRVL